MNTKSDLPADDPAAADHAAPQPVRFFHRGRRVEVAGAGPTRSVLDWLREDALCTGTKEGCNEGDCGACTVVVGELSGPDDTLALRTVNACLLFLPALDGRALFTVEDLKRLNDGELHPVQQALVACHGSQCGFCTPGFAMSLWSVYEHHQAGGTRPGREQLAHELAGNLCRCTGYRPLLDAGERMFEAVPVRLDRGPVVAALQSLRRSGAEVVRHEASSRGSPRCHVPLTLEALAALRLRLPQARLIAGATDVGLWVNKQFRPLGDDLVFLGRVAGLADIATTADGGLRIGAGATLEAAWRALTARHAGLAEVWQRFASPPIRHAGTMGGNVANGSPIGDSAPVLMALDAQVELRRGDAVRLLPLSSFYLGYMANALQPGEFLQAITLPPAHPGLRLRAYKVGKRFDSDISALCAGLAIGLGEAPGGQVVTHVRLAFGGMAATVRRADQAEAALLGRPWSPESLRDAQQALARDFTPLSDLRASAAYRLQVAQNLLQRFWLETREDAPLPVQQLRVWAVDPAQAAGGPP